MRRSSKFELNKEDTSFPSFADWAPVYILPNHVITGDVEEYRRAWAEYERQRESRTRTA